MGIMHLGILLICILFLRLGKTFFFVTVFGLVIRLANF